MAKYKFLTWMAIVMVACISAGALISPAKLPQNCVCSKQRKCKCCKEINFNHKLREIQINDTVCVKIRNLKSKTGFRFAVSWNKRSLISHRLTTDNVPPFCFAAPYANAVDVCLTFKRLRIASSEIKGCLQYEIDSQSTAKVFHGGCFQLTRKATSSNETEGNPFSLLRSSETRRISFTNTSPLNSFMHTMKGINKTSLALWMKLAKNNAAQSLLNKRNRKRTKNRSNSDCRCDNRTVVTCQCCVPINNKDSRHTGCANMTHVPYSKVFTITFMLDNKLTIKESIPIKITKKLCTHHKTTNNLKVGVCIKPVIGPQQRQNRKSLCVDIDARKPHYRFKHRVGCVSLTYY